MGNSACEYRTANKRCARRTFASKCQARARVELRVIGSRGQNARSSASIAVSLGYRNITDCVRGFDPRNACNAQVGYQVN
eukprot:6210245-Pleurochrysis_carterae.AAC.5